MRKLQGLLKCFGSFCWPKQWREEDGIQVAQMVFLLSSTAYFSFYGQLPFVPRVCPGEKPMMMKITQWNYGFSPSCCSLSHPTKEEDKLMKMTLQGRNLSKAASPSNSLLPSRIGSTNIRVDCEPGTEKDGRNTACDDLDCRPIVGSVCSYARAIDWLESGGDYSAGGSSGSETV